MTSGTALLTERDGATNLHEIERYDSFAATRATRGPAQDWWRHHDTPRPDALPSNRQLGKLEVRRVFVPFGINTSASVSDDLFLAASRDIEAGIDAVVTYLDEAPHVIDVSVDEDLDALDERYTVWARTDLHGDDRRVLKAELLDWWQKNFAWMHHDVLLVVL